MSIRGHQRPLAPRIFDRVFLPWMRARIDLRIAGLPRKLEADRPLILIANHVSWWDGFLLREVHRAMRPTGLLYTVMLESELRRQRILRSIGAVGMNPASPSSIARCVRTLDDRLRRRPDSMIAFFPQGRIWPSHRRPLGFQRGVELFARHLPGADLLPIGIHIEPLNRVSPTAFVAAGEVIRPGITGVDAAQLEGEVERQLDGVYAFLAAHGERAAAEWPSVHRAVPSVGVS